HTRRDLPRHAPLVLAPAARALLAAIADDGVPIAVGLGLIVSGDLEREGFAVFEHGTAVEADTGDAGNLEIDCQHVSLLAGRVVAGCTVDGIHRAVGKGLCIKASSGLGIPVVPETNRVLCHCMSFRFHGGPISGYAAFLKSPICASNARLKAGREVQRSTYAARGACKVLAEELRRAGFGSRAQET